MTTISVKNGTDEFIENIEKIEKRSVLNRIQSQIECKDNVINDADIQETLNEDDFIEGLDVVDTWEDEEKDKPRRRSWDRTRGRDKRNSRDREKERERDREMYHSRRRSRSAEKKKDLARRDPNKSSKDIEQDKMRTKKDNDNKILAEKEKAIKTLLDSDNVLPPGTEGEAIQNIVDRNQKQEEEESSSKIKRNSRENRRRSPIRSRLGYRRFSPRRSPLQRSVVRSPDRRRTPIALSPDRRRRRSPHQLSPDDRRRRIGSFERENSTERREASRRRLREREGKYGRRSRSRDRRSMDRHRSRSLDRHRRSRSPFDRHSPRRLHNSRRRSLSRSPIRSPNRNRRRSPFINELARQFQTDSMRVDNSMLPMQQPLGVMHNMGPFLPSGGGPPGMHPGGPQSIDPRMMPGGPGLLSAPQGMMPGPPGMAPGIPPGPLDMHPGAVMHSGPQGVPGPPFINYDGCQPVPPGINFDPINRGPPPPDYNSTSVMYNQGNTIPSMNSIPHTIQPSSPQPVPAPGQGTLGGVMYNVSMGPSVQHQQSSMLGPKYSPNPYANHNCISPNEDIYRSHNKREERMKTPEPPIISDFKPNEKTSLSSLLEASVSTKDSSDLIVSFRGFRPEIIRHCERALRSLPVEDPRLKMKGRFFFDPSKKDKMETTSNSILLRKDRIEIHWDEEEHQLSTSVQQHLPERKRFVTHQKICQTDEPTKESVSTQVEPATNDFSMQVCLQDLNQNLQSKDERRSVIDRLDWSMRETYDHAPKLHDNEDLRWSLSNNLSRDRQMHPWLQGFSPNRQPIVSSGGTHISPIDMRTNMDHLRDRSSIDRPIDVRDRNMDLRTRGLDLREREMDLRSKEIIKERERELERERMLELRDIRGNLIDGGRGLGEYGGRRESADDYDIRKNFSGSYNRSMETMERERKDMHSRCGSPVMLDDDSEELEIIEERLLERDQPWQSRSSSNSLKQFNNTRSAVVSSSSRSNSSVNKPFRGRISGYHMKF